MSRFVWVYRCPNHGPLRNPVRLSGSPLPQRTPAKTRDRTTVSYPSHLQKMGEERAESSRGRSVQEQTPLRSQGPRSLIPQGVCPPTVVRLSQTFIHALTQSFVRPTPHSPSFSDSLRPEVLLAVGNFVFPFQQVFVLVLQG